MSIQLVRFFSKRRTMKRLHAMQNETRSQQRKYHNPYFEKKTMPPNTAAVHTWVRRDGWALVGIVLFVFGGIWYFGFHQQRFLIRQTNIQGVQFISEDELRGVVHSFVTSKAFGIIPRDTYWTLDTEALQKRIEDHFATTYSLSSVSVEKELPSTIHIRIEERIPSLTWITAKEKSAERFYTIDRDGVVTQSIGRKEELRSDFPVFYDMNRERVEIGWHIISKSYIDFALTVHEQFTVETDIQMESLALPEVHCQEKQYVAEQIFKQEILDSASAEFKEKKRAIQERFQNRELTVDQSLEALEQIKNEELQAVGELTSTADGTQPQQTEWQAIYVPVECDIVKVATDVLVHTEGENGGFDVLLDSSVDLNQQLLNLVRVLNEKISDRQSIRYIDVRIPDRVYYK